MLAAHGSLTSPRADPATTPAPAGSPRKAPRANTPEFRSILLGRESELEALEVAGESVEVRAQGREQLLAASLA